MSRSRLGAVWVRRMPVPVKLMAERSMRMANSEAASKLTFAYPSRSTGSVTGK